MLAEIAARLQAEAPSLKVVAGAIEFAALAGRVPPRERQPAAYVLPIEERAGANTLINAVRQLVEARIGVAIALGNLKDPRGGETSALLESVRSEIRAALLGWAPSADDEPLTFARGAAIAFEDGVAWWLDEFTTGFTLSAT